MFASETAHETIGKFLLNSRIMPRMYVMRSTMYENAAFYQQELTLGNISIVACGFSPIKLHYSDNPKRINEVVFSMKLSLQRYFLDNT